MATINSKNQRKRLPVTLAGSALIGARGFHKAPPVTPKAKPQKPVVELLPSCPHGGQLTSKEYQSQVPNGQIQLVQLDNGSIVQRPLHSWACLRCHPYCIHEQDLTEEDITLGVKQSSTCVICFPPRFSTNPAAWNETLSKMGYGVGRGMSMVEEVKTLADGSVKISGYSKNLCTGGGSKQMEDADTKAEFGGESGIGHRGEADSDEQNRVNELNEPVSTKSDFIAKCESIKRETISNHIADQLIDAETETNGLTKELKPESKPESPEPEIKREESHYNDIRGMKALKISKEDKKLFREIKEDILVDTGETIIKEDSAEEDESWRETFFNKRNAEKTDSTL
jgi:hypothetical protein